MPAAELAAIYAALNGSWPSRVLLMHFAASANVRMSDPAGHQQSIREKATELLLAQGNEPPTRTRGGGKGKRLTYRYPVDGILGARPHTIRVTTATPTTSAKRDTQRLERLQTQLGVVSVRVWLAGLSAADPRTRAGYRAWELGTDWTPVSTFDRNNRGGFTKVKNHATAANAQVRAAGQDPLADALAQAAAIRAQINTLKGAGAERAQINTIKDAGAVRAANVNVPFSDALRTAIAGPHAEIEAPKQ
ncbi:MAG: hypothetical protein ACLP01_28490 [Solirubrobacteraceae bacterium]